MDRGVAFNQRLHGRAVFGVGLAVVIINHQAVAQVVVLILQGMDVFVGVGHALGAGKVAIGDDEHLLDLGVVIAGHLLTVQVNVELVNIIPRLQQTQHGQFAAVFQGFCAGVVFKEIVFHLGAQLVGGQQGAVDVSHRIQPAQCADL